MKIIIGLGNPEPEYSGTRHNIGFEVVNQFRSSLKLPIFSLKTEFRALVSTSIINNQKIILVKPQTYMNLSGETVRKIMDYYHENLENLLIVFDDKDLDFGILRLKKNSSSGGHNGIKSIIQYLDTQKFHRLKIGIGSPAHPQIKTSDYVLSRFNTKEKSVLPEIIIEATIKIQEWIDK